LRAAEEERDAGKRARQKSMINRIEHFGSQISCTDFMSGDLVAQGLKPASFADLSGKPEAVPFPICEISSGTTNPDKERAP
jgi:hypothetical protein